MSDTIIDVTATLFRLKLNDRQPVQRGMLEDFGKGEPYEPGTWQTFLDLVKPGDTVVDVGAHIGVFTCLMASIVGPTGHVYAFEPDPRNRKTLTENVALNGFQDWVTIDQRVVSDRNGSVTFFTCADDDGGHALWNPARLTSNVKSRANPKQQIVESTTLELLQDVRLIKIDTEGAELNVIKGARAMIDRCKPAVIAEINAQGLVNMGASEVLLREYMRSLGYTEYGIVDTPPYRVPVAADETMQQEIKAGTSTLLPVFNMLFLPA